MAAAAAARCANKYDEFVVNCEATEACDVGTIEVGVFVTAAAAAGFSAAAVLPTVVPNHGHAASGKRYPDNIV